MGDLGDGVTVDLRDEAADAVTEQGTDSAILPAAAAASSTSASKPLPTVAGNMTSSSEASVAGGSDEAPAASETSSTAVFRMDDGDGDALLQEPAEADLPPTASQGSGAEVGGLGGRSPDGHLQQEDDGAGAAAVVPTDSKLAHDVRSRFQWLNSKDQKTTVRRECQLAEKREASLASQMQRTIDAYTQALEANRLAETLDDGQGPVLSAEAVIKYQERIEFLRGTIAVLEAEPAVSLPQMTALETTKGLVFDSYAKTAQGVKSFGDQTGMSEPVVQVADKAVTGARAAFASLSSMVRGRSSSGSDGYPTGGNPATVSSFLASNSGSASSSSQ